MKILIVGVTLLGLCAALVGTGMVGAQEGDRPGGRFITKVAENLGVSEQELTTAMTDAQLEIINESVAEGRITEEQAERLKERVEEYGPLSVLGLRYHRACHAAIFLADAAATVLGMEVEELTELLRSGQSMLQVAESQGMAAANFKAALLAEVKADLDTKVADGSITQQQVDRAYQRTENNIERIVNFVPSEEGPRPCRPHHDGPGDEAPPAAES